MPEIFTRIKHKHDTEANWANIDFIPLEGELIIYDPDVNNTTSRFKIGNGITAVTELPFVADTKAILDTVALKADKSYVDSIIPTVLPANGGNADTVNGFTIKKMTQEAYDELAIKDQNTLYIIA